MQRLLTTISLVYKDGLLKVGRKVKGKNKHAISLTFKINEYTCYFRNVNELLIQKKKNCLKQNNIVLLKQ